MTDPNELVSVRYMVDDVDKALDFYCTHLGFEPNVGLVLLAVGPGRIAGDAGHLPQPPHLVQRRQAQRPGRGNRRQTVHPI